MKYLLIGNPNVGKSSLFNRLTSTFSHVGNIGGLTVDAKVGAFEYGEIVDLPGCYSVAPSSEDEGLVTSTLLKGDFDGIINIVDGTHLKRNLHLSLELLELGVPLYLVVNMVDELEASGFVLDQDRLMQRLGIPVTVISAKNGLHVDTLKTSLQQIPPRGTYQVIYHPIIEQAIDAIIQSLPDVSINPRWLAIQLLCGNEGVLALLSEAQRGQVLPIIERAEFAVSEKKIAHSLKGLIYSHRRDAIQQLLDGVLIQIRPINQKKQITHRIDRLIMHPVWGLIIFIFILLGVYTFTFDLVGNRMSNWLEGMLFNRMATWLESFLIDRGIPSNHLFLRLLMKGIIPGVGGVLVFIPNIMLLFILIAIVDGTGYMARVAVMLDTLLKRFGLNGKSIVPLITGIGCNVPAIMATRTIEDPKERRLTMLIIPFMSCSARIPIYALIGSIFFERYRGLIILSMYFIGTAVALFSAKWLSLSLFKINQQHFILEMPPYRWPLLRNVYRYSKTMVMDFIAKAGQFILLGTIILFFLQELGPYGMVENQEQSYLAYIGRFIAPLFTLLGFGNWQASSSLIIGFFAKELIYSSMMVIYGSKEAITLMFTPASAFAFMVFSLLYMPCLATVGVIRSESHSLRYTTLSLVFTFVVSYTVSLLIYGFLKLILY